MADRIRVTTSLPNGTEVTAGWILHEATRGRLRPAVNFEYDNGYLTTPTAFALSPDLPLVRGLIPARFDLAIFGAFADSSPDQWGRRLIEAERRRRARAAGIRVSPLDELGLLLAMNDTTRQGALRFPDHTTEAVTPALDTLDLEELTAAVAVFEETGDEERLRDIVPLGTTQGGARPKVAVLNGRGHLAIAKLPRPSDRWDVEAWEFATNRMAAAAGIDVPAVELHRITEYRSVLVTTRFDRPTPDTRRPYISAHTLLQVGAAGGIWDYATLAREVTAQSDRPSEDGAELFRRVVFSLLVNNVDDHLRNHGFLRSTSGWEIAPAFDVNPHPTFGSLEATPVNADDDPRDRSLVLLLESTDAFRVTRKRATQVIAEVAEVVDGWPAHARESGIPADGLAAMAGAFESPTRGEAERLISGG